MLMVVMRVAGNPISSMVKAPITGRVGLMIKWDTMPKPMTPGVSPRENSGMVIRLCEGVHIQKILNAGGKPTGPNEMLG